MIEKIYVKPYVLELYCDDCNKWSYSKIKLIHKYIQLNMFINVLIVIKKLFQQANLIK